MVPFMTCKTSVACASRKVIMTIWGHKNKWNKITKDLQNRRQCSYARHVAYWKQLWKQSQTECMCHMYTPITKHTLSYSLLVCVCVSLSLFPHVWWSTQCWGATFSERDCTDVNDILLVLSATSYTSPWEGTGSIDRRAVAKSWTGFLQSGLIQILIKTFEGLFGYTRNQKKKKKHAVKVCSITSLFSSCEQNSCKLQLD